MLACLSKVKLFLEYTRRHTWFPTGTPPAWTVYQDRVPETSGKSLTQRQKSKHRTKEPVPGRNCIKLSGHASSWGIISLFLCSMVPALLSVLGWLPEWHSHLALAFCRHTEHSWGAGTCIYFMKCMLATVHAPSIVLGTRGTSTAPVSHRNPSTLLNRDWVLDRLLDKLGRKELMKKGKERCLNANSDY